MPDTEREAEMLRAERVNRELGPKRKRSGPSRIIARPTPTRSADAITPDPEVLVEEVEVGGGSSSGGGRNNDYVTVSYEKQVFVALSLALLFVLMAAYGRQKLGSTQKMSTLVDPKPDPAKFAFSWVGIFVVLLSLSVFRGTDKLAAAFAWLIFVAVLLINGEQAFALINSKSTGGHSVGGSW